LQTTSTGKAARVQFNCRLHPATTKNDVHVGTFLVIGTSKRAGSQLFIETSGDNSSESENVKMSDELPINSDKHSECYDRYLPQTPGFSLSKCTG